MEFVLIIVAIALLDRVLVWAEGKGWLRWRHRSRTPAAASALLEFQAFWDPAVRHTIDERRTEKLTKAQVPAAPPDPTAIPKVPAAAGAPDAEPWSPRS